jgi:hypothetical protein
MTANQLITQYRDNVRRLYDALARVQADAAILAVTPADEIAVYFVDEQGTPREGLDLSADEFGAANGSLLTLLASAQAELPKLRKLL